MSDTLSIHDQSTFYDENGKTISHKDINRKKQLDAYIYIPSDSVVLEIGSQYGVVSCLINRTLEDPKNHLVVESDINSLTKNRDHNNCQFQIFNGILSSLKELETTYSLDFNVLIADCEESLYQLIQNDDLRKIKIILLEPRCSCDHQRVKNHLTQLGFSCMRNTDRAIYVNTNFLPFNLISYYTPDGNIGLFGRLGHMSGTNNLITDSNEICGVSVHAPSHLEIETQRELLVRGYASPTAQDCPILYFKVGDCQIGQVSKGGSKTDGYRLLPGKHRLGIHPSTVSWAHSAWLFEEPKKFEPVDQKYFKIDIFQTGRGLVNQLINLINGVTLINATGRHIYNPRFLPNYNNTDWIPLSDVFDIPHFNQMFASLGLKVQIITDESTDQKEWIKPDYYNGACLQMYSRVKVIDKLLKEEYPYVDLGEVFATMLDSNSDIDKIELEFYKNMRFVPEIHSALDYIKNNFLGEKYNVLHLRLEHDFVGPYADYGNRDYEEYTMILLKRYFGIMEKMFSPDDKIYLATHLLKADYPNNYVIDLIREKYPNIIVATPWREHINAPLGREIDAIIDYLIAINAEKFIGMHGSTFSILINKINKSKGKESQLTNPYVN